MNQRSNNRSAFTLIELTITMAAGSTLMMLTIGLVHKTMTLSSMGRQQCDHQRSMNRLASQFRRDVHRAIECTAETPQRMQLVLPGDKRISYEAHANQLTRLRPLNDGATHRELFELHEHAMVTFELLERPQRAAVTIEYHVPDNIAVTRVDRRIVAVVGRLNAHQSGEVSP